MTTVATCLWFDAGQAEKAAAFYVGLLPGSRIDKITHAPSDYPSGKEGVVLTVEFTIAGQHYLGLNGGPAFSFTEAVSIQVLVETQAEIDRLWAALIADGGSESRCGWLKDRWGLSWQIAPAALPRMLGDPDRVAAARAMQAMMGMVKLDIAAVERAFRGDTG